jgi:hypothetical protein
MRTEVFLRPATSRVIALAVAVAAAAIGAPGPTFAACGVSSGSSTGIVQPPSSNAGVHVGATGSTHGTSPSSCPSMSNKTVTANGSMPGGGVAGAHIFTRSGLTATNHNLRTTNLQTHTGTTNKTANKANRPRT